MDHIARLVVLNKRDLVSPDVVANLTRLHHAVAISAHDRRTLAPLIERMQEAIWEQVQSTARLTVASTATA
jgi:50S ribosomal subunit-associated GTPase HflX